MTIQVYYIEETQELKTDDGLLHMILHRDIKSGHLLYFEETSTSTIAHIQTNDSVTIVEGESVFQSLKLAKLYLHGLEESMKKQMAELEKKLAEEQQE